MIAQGWPAGARHGGADNGRAARAGLTYILGNSCAGQPPLSAHPGFARTRFSNTASFFAHPRIHEALIDQSSAGGG